MTDSGDAYQVPTDKHVAFPDDKEYNFRVTYEYTKHLGVRNMPTHMYTFYLYVGDQAGYEFTGTGGSDNSKQEALENAKAVARAEAANYVEQQDTPNNLTEKFTLKASS